MRINRSLSQFTRTASSKFRKQSLSNLTIKQ